MIFERDIPAKGGGLGRLRGAFRGESQALIWAEAARGKGAGAASAISLRGRGKK